jgi:hypothetical protein
METKGPVTNPGNIKKAVYKGKRYLYEFVTENTGRAYFLVKDGTEDKKGAYAGAFTKVPASIDPSVPEDSLGGEGTTTPAVVLKKEEVIVTPVVPVKPTVTLKPVAETKPTATAAATAAATGYFQKQESLGCGRHALNNLFGRTVFLKGKVGDPMPFPPGKEPYSLLGICTAVNKILRKKGIQESCLSNENYDVNTIQGATDYLGYKTEAFTATKTLDETGEFVGFLVNLGLVAGKPKHWIALKFKERTADGTVLYDLYDSLNSGPVENIPYSVFAAQHPQPYLVKVLLPKGAPINPEVRLSLLVDVAAPTAADVKYCSLYYDPCTRKPIKDIAALEARVAELKAIKAVKAGGSRKNRKTKGRQTRKGTR